MGSLSKLPPEVARELLRHVSPRPLPKSPQATKAAAATKLYQQQQQQQSSKQGSSGGGWVLAGCVAFTGAAFSIPFVAQQWIGNLNSRDQPLTHAQIRRGAFLNSGSTDAGRDPQWDFRKGQYKKDEKYYSLFDNSNDNAAQQVFGSAAVVVSSADSDSDSEHKNDNATKPQRK